MLREKLRGMMNQIGLFEVEDHDELEMASSSSSQMGLIFYPSPFGTNMSSTSTNTSTNSLSLPFCCNQSPRKSSNFTTTTIPQSSSLAAADSPKDQNHFGGPHQLLSLQRSAHINLWTWGQENDCITSSSNNYIKRRNNIIGSENDDHNHNLGISAIKMKKIKAGGGGGRRKVREPRFCFKTLSTDVDVLDDGYKWRKYGQKVVKNTLHPRSYYRCTQDNCRVKKRVERLAEDPRMVITTYEGRHVHSPSQDEDDSSSQLNNFFW